MYDNILKALGSGNSSLSYEDQAQNYSIFSDLMKKGVRLQDLIDKANAPKDPAMDEALFSVMENAVQDVLEVESAKKSQIEALNRFLKRLSSEDPECQKAEKAYRDAVVKAYTEKKGLSRAEMTKDPGTDGEADPPEIRNEGPE